MRAFILCTTWALLLLAPPAHAGSYLVIHGEVGDFVTLGQRVILAEPRASFFALRDFGSTPSQDVLVDINGRHAARVSVRPRPGYPLVAGTYENAQPGMLDAPYLSVSALSGCIDMVGRFVVNEIATDAEGNLTTLSLDFEGKCPAALGGFEGRLRYRRGDPACASDIDEAPCDDENPCTTSDACVDGRCTGAEALTCPTAGQCELSMCSPWTGECDLTFQEVGTPCEDGNGCTVDDACIAAYCVPGSLKSCGDSDVCTNDWCVEGACVSTPVECPASSDPCQVPVCINTSGCISQQVPECCRADIDCDDDDLCTQDTCDPKTHRCTNDALECWLLRGKTRTTVSADGRSSRQSSPFSALLIVEPGGRYRLPKFAGCLGDVLIDDVGSLVPWHSGRSRLVPENLDEQRAAYRSCSPPLNLRRRNGWVHIDYGGEALRGSIGLGGKGRYRGVPFTFAIGARFGGRPIAHAREGTLGTQHD